MTRNGLMQVLQWHLYRTVEKLGSLGNAAIMLLVLTVIAYFILLRPLTITLEDMKLLAVGQSQHTVNTEITDADRASAFQQALPSISKRASAIQLFMDIAIAEGLQPNEISYKTEVRSGEPFSHYHVEFSLYAPYADIQHFLSVLLHALNYVSIESLTLSRESVKDEDVEARVQLVFHFNRQTVALAGQAQKTASENSVGQAL